MSGEKQRGLLQAIRGVRDSIIEDSARLTLAWTSSNTYQSISASIARPLLLTTALVRKATASRMASMLARLNMPSREDVLSLSQRLTRIEMVLDDVGAGMDQMRRAAARAPRPAVKDRETTGNGHPGTTVNEG